jgi:alpha-D-ribose 1-methylphosphonate 5-triphosphate synthase subunit PhnH
MPLPSAFEAQTHATFDCLMWALAYPGRIGSLPLRDGQTAFGTIAEALLDLETSAWSDDPKLEKTLRVLGAKSKPLDQASYVFCQTPPALEWLRLLRRGSLLAPETAATLIVSAQLGTAQLGTGTTLRLSGVGIEQPIELQVDLSKAFFAVREEVIAYPVGWDVLVVDGAKLLGLPRTTQVEVV